MKSMQALVPNPLFWRFALIALSICLVIGAFTINLVIDTAFNFSQEATHSLNKNVAQRITMEPDFKPYIDGAVNEPYLDSLFHYVMVYNPNLELYFLDMEGNVLSYFAPKSKIKVQQVSLGPIEAYLADSSGGFIVGDDPRNPGMHKPFSAARVQIRDTEMGYIYVVMQSQELETVKEGLRQSYMISMGVKSLAIILLTVVLVSWGSLYFLTRNLNRIIRVVRRFSEGDQGARIQIGSRGTITQLAEDFNEMADSIVSNMAQIKEVEQQRKEFVSNISHDLRAPLAAIYGYSELINASEQPFSEDDCRKYSKTILAHAGRLQKLVEDLFQLSQLKAGLPKEAFETVAMTEMVADSVQQYRVEFEQRELALKLDFPEDFCWVEGDAGLIDRAIQNLLQNALHYTPSGGEVEVKVERRKGEIQVSIENSGPGIAEKELARLFDRYAKGRMGMGKGTGLGLAIVKEIMELHGGAAEAQSNPGHRTVFSLRFPAPGSL